tara:strand:+ start:690 stop:908 length:219 start_codon:yes stop_codon:yes gene_type:complete
LAQVDLEAGNGTRFDDDDNDNDNDNDNNKNASTYATKKMPSKIMRILLGSISQPLDPISEYFGEEGERDETS